MLARPMDFIPFDEPAPEHPTLKPETSNVATPPATSEELAAQPSNKPDAAAVREDGSGAPALPAAAQRPEAGADRCGRSAAGGSTDVVQGSATRPTTDDNHRQHLQRQHLQQQQRDSGNARHTTRDDGKVGPPSTTATKEVEEEEEEGEYRPEAAADDAAVTMVTAAAAAAAFLSTQQPPAFPAQPSAAAGRNPGWAQPAAGGPASAYRFQPSNGVPPWAGGSQSGVSLGPNPSWGPASR